MKTQNQIIEEVYDNYSWNINSKVQPTIKFHNNDLIKALKEIVKLHREDELKFLKELIKYFPRTISNYVNLFNDLNNRIKELEKER